MTESERRFTPGRVEVRSDSEKRTIGGYAAKFDKPSQNLGGFIERIAPRAFNRSKGNDWPNVMARYNHDDNELLGRTSSGTLRLLLDDTGLNYEVDLLPEHSKVYNLIKRGDITESSFAFRVIGEDGEEWGLSDQNFPQRTLLSVDLVDVAPVNTPAYLDTSTGVRKEGPDPSVALRSLARYVHASDEDVRKLAAEDQLRKFFMRTDAAGKPAPKNTFGPEARMLLLARKEDPLAS